MTDQPRESDEREQRLQDVIAAYLDAEKDGAASSRDEWLARHPDLADDLRRFLDNHAWANRLREPLRSEGASVIPETRTESEASPSVLGVVRYFGDYELLNEVARGGMGVVYRARQVSLNRTVALKMILAGQLAGPAEVRRFRAEAESAANLDHPHIVPIYEVGDHEGQHYFSMKLVEGGSLAGRLSASGGRLPPNEVVRLVATVARAVHFAHQRGILHRDLKPQNILLDRDGTPLVGDFGLARRVEGEGGQTQSGAVVGTPEYMAPEQALAEKQPTIAVDIWALGAILYRCLTGRPPFPAATVFDTLWKVVHEESVPPRQLDPKVPRDLETICLKCLRKDPGRRYATAEELGRDLERWQVGEPILARPVGRMERVVKWARRKPSQAALVVVSALATLVLVITGAAFTLRLTAEVERAEKAERETEDRADDEAKARKKVVDEALRADTARHAIQIDLALRAWKQHDVTRAEEVLGAVPPAFQQTWETRHLRDLCRRKALPLLGHTDAVHSVCFSPDGKRIVSGSGDKPVRVWDAQTGQETLTLQGASGPVAFSPDGKRVVSRGNDGTVSLEVLGASTVGLLGSPFGQGPLLAASALIPGRTETVKVWDAQTGKNLLTLKGHTSPVISVSFSPDGKRIAAGSADHTVKVWDAQTGQEVLTLKGHTGYVLSVAFSADGKRIVSASWDLMSDKSGEVKVWDAQTGQHLLTLKGHTFAVLSVAFSADGKRIVSGSGDQTVKVWDAQTGQQQLTLKGHINPVWSVAFSADGKRIVSGGFDKTVKVWDAHTGQETLTLQGHTGPVYSVAFSADGKRIASGGMGYDPKTDKGWGDVKVWDAQTGQETLTLKGHTDEVRSVAFSTDGKRIASGSADKTVKVWDAHTGQEALTLKGHTSGVHSVAFSPDGKRIVSGSMDKTVKVWDAQTGQGVLTLKGHTGGVSSVAFSADGKRIASPSDDDTVKVWDAHTGQELLSLKGHTGLIHSVAFSADGKRIVSGSGDDTVKVWDAHTGQEMLTLKGHTGPVTSVAFSLDGKRIVSGSYDETVKVWDAHTGQETLTLKGHTDFVSSVAFSADGERIVSGSYDGTLRVWDAHTGQETLTLKGHTNIVYSVCFSPDGKRIASGSQDQTVKVWDASVSPE